MLIDGGWLLNHRFIGMREQRIVIAAELLKLVERAVLDPKKEGKPWLREGNFDSYIFKKVNINSGLLVMTNKKRTTKKRSQLFWPIQGTPEYNLRKCTIKDSA